MSGYHWPNFEANGTELERTVQLVEYVTNKLSYPMRGHVTVWPRCNGWGLPKEVRTMLDDNTTPTLTFCLKALAWRVRRS